MSIYKQLGSAEPGLETINSPKTMSFDELKSIVQQLATLDGDGEINLTPIAKVFGKRVDNFQRNKADVLAEIVITQNEGTDKIAENQPQALRTKKGNNGEQGTFTNNPDVFLEFLRYCSPKIAVAMTKIVRELFEGKTQTPPPISTAEGLLASIQLMVNLEKVQKIQAEAIKKQGEKLLELETKATGVVVDIHSVKDYTTVKELEMDYLGREINYFVNQKFVEARGFGFRDAHRTAWKDYKADTGFDYAGAKFATKESKQDFLNWLKSL